MSARTEARWHVTALVVVATAVVSVAMLMVDSKDAQGSKRPSLVSAVNLVISLVQF